MIDIVIPVFNEERILKEKYTYYKKLSREASIIFVDGGSSDGTIGLAKDLGRVVFSEKGRASQKNKGAEISGADFLLFLHVDSFITPEALANLRKVISDGAIGGCFTMEIEGSAVLFRVLEAWVNRRARYRGAFDGDLGQFIKRDIFTEIGGFDDIPVMEDIIFGYKIKASGRVDILPDIIKVSPRKWYEEGFIRTFYNYFLAHIRFQLGKSKGLKRGE